MIHSGTNGLSNYNPVIGNMLNHVLFAWLWGHLPAGKIYKAKNVKTPVAPLSIVDQTRVLA